jgi:hypothetical protein
MISPLHYYPQADGPGFIQFIGPDNVGSEFGLHFYNLTEEMDRSIQDTLARARWYPLFCPPLESCNLAPGYC